MRLVLDARTATFAASLDSTVASGPGGDPADAITVDRDLRGGDHGWVAGLIVVPASRLLLLGAAAMAEFRHGDRPLRVAASVDLPLGESMSAIVAFHQEMSPAIDVTRIVIPAATEDEIVEGAEAAAALDPETACFFSLDEAAAPEVVSAIRGALVDVGRTGGFSIRRPTVTDVSAAVWESSYGAVPFLVEGDTGGPFSSEVLGGISAGIINTIVAAAAADEGEPRATIEEIVSDTDASSFALTASAIAWRGYAFPAPAITSARRNGPLSFGSSDPEGMALSLAAMGLLGAGT